MPIVHFNLSFDFEKGDIVFDGKKYLYVVEMIREPNHLTVNFKKVSSNWLIRCIQVFILKLKNK